MKLFHLKDGDICFYIGEQLYARTSGNIERAGRYMFIEMYNPDPYVEPERFDTYEPVEHFGLDMFEPHSYHYRLIDTPLTRRIVKTLLEISDLSDIRKELTAIAKRLIAEENQTPAMTLDDLLFSQ